MAQTLRQTRPPVQRERIVGDIRGRIVSGKYPAGSRLPTHKELVRRYATGPVTVQDALDQLRSEGFIATHSRRGIYVASHPPHLSRYGLVFHERPGAGGHVSSFLRALMDGAKQDRERKIDFFYEMDPYHDRDREAYQDLLETVLNDRIAGLVFTHNPFMLLPTPVIRKPGLPRVGVMSGFVIPGVSSVFVDFPNWLERALDAVAAHGRKRVAILGTPDFLFLSSFQQGVRRRGMIVEDHWVQGVTVEMGEWVGRVVRAVMHGPAGRRPNALLIADDNLLKHATAGLVEAGLRVPEDVYVIAHTNFPYPAPAAVPVERLGFDVRAILRACWNLIDLQRRGEPRPQETQLVPPIFEHEFNPNAAPIAAHNSSTALGD